MSADPLVQVKFQGDPELIEEIRQETSGHGEVEILSTGMERDPTYLHFGLAEVASLIAIVQGAYWVGDLARKVHGWVTGKKDRRLFVQTPFGQWDFVSDDDLTEEDVRTALAQLAGRPL
jgi:hypothetical protein